jgi:hypothetical protein
MRIKRVRVPQLLGRWALCRAGLPSPRPRVFFIGFNKCGTRSLHDFFHDNGYLSLHGISLIASLRKRRCIARQMQYNEANGRAILDKLEHYDVFSDMTYLDRERFIEGNSYFRQLARAFPDAYFILNDRSVDRWVRSRLFHEDNRRGSFLERYSAATGIPRSDVPAQWKSCYQTHKHEVLDYFGGHPRFMVFDIESDEPEKLSRFVDPHYRLDTALWKQRGSTAGHSRKFSLARSRLLPGGPENASLSFGRPLMTDKTPR